MDPAMKIRHNQRQTQTGTDLSRDPPVRLLIFSRKPGAGLPQYEAGSKEQGKNA